MDDSLLLGLVLSYFAPAIIVFTAISVNLIKMFRRGSDILFSDLLLLTTSFIPLFNFFVMLIVFLDIIANVNLNRVVISKKKTLHPRSSMDRTGLS